MRCAFCHGPLDAGQACPGCGTRLHADCWAQAQGCPTLGCGRPAGPGAKPRPHSRGPVVALIALPALIGLFTAIVIVSRGAHKAVDKATLVDPVLVLEGQDGHAEQVAFTPECDRVVAQFEHTVTVWTVPGGERVGHFWVRQRRAPPRTFALSPDGRTLAIGRTLHAIPGGEVVGELPVECLAWSPDGALVAGIESGTFVVADRAGSWARTMSAPSLPIGGRAWKAVATFSPDGALLATASHDRLQLWDVKTGNLLVTRAHVLAWSAPRPTFVDDGRLLLSFGEQDVWIGRVDGSDAMTPLHVPSVTSTGRPYLASGAVSPDGTLIATGSLYGDVRLWTRLGARVDSLRPGAMSVQALAFSPDRRWLASGHLENVVRVWRLRP